MKKTLINKLIQGAREDSLMIEKVRRREEKRKDKLRAVIDAASSIYASKEGLNRAKDVKQ